jgi:DNA-binding MarR family transcriptional regulator
MRYSAQKTGGIGLNSDKLTEKIFETFDSINVETLFEKLKFSLKGENMLLAILNNTGGECSLSTITKNFGFTAARLSAVIKSLEVKGFVERRQNEKDKRKSTVALTSEGAVQFLRYRQEAIANALVIIEELGEEDVCEFLRIIRKISDIANTQSKLELIDNQ